MAGGIPQNLLANLSVRLGMDTKAFNLGTKQAKQNISGFEKSLSGVKALFGAAFGAIAVRQLIQFGKASVEAYDKQIKNETLLLTALKGRQDIQKRLILQAQTLQTRTLFGDEATIEAQSRLATILGVNERAIKRLIPLIQDFATAKRMDLAMAAELVAKSVGSSTNALSRYGVVIEGAVGSSERLESAVKALKEQFEGQAEAAAEVGTGVYEQWKNKLGDISEELGERIVPYLAVSSRLLLGIFGGMPDESLTDMERLKNTITDLDKEGLQKLLETFKKYADATFKQWKYAKEHGKATTELATNYDVLKEKIDIVKQALEDYDSDSIKRLPLLDEINQKIKDQTDLWKASVTKEELALRRARLDQLKEEKRILEELGSAGYKEKQELEKQKGQPIPVYKTGKTIQLGRPEEAPGLMSAFQGDEIVDKWALTAADLDAINQGIKQSFTDLTIGMTEAFSEMAFSSEGFKPGALLLPIANVAENLGKLAISVGMTEIALEESLKTLGGGGAIAAGIALVALAQMVKSKVSSMSSGATGGANFSSFAHAENWDRTGTRYYGQTAAQEVHVTFDDAKIDGETIRLAVKRADTRHAMQS